MLAFHRDPESYVSADIDIFHDREDRVARAAEYGVAALRDAGMDVSWARREPLFYQALISGDGESTRLEWVVDSDFRFFPAQQDAEFGFVLHPADLATNKIMAAAGRREPRDVVDLVDINARILPLGAVVWAAVGRSLGFTPEGLLSEVRRMARYTAADFEQVASEPPVDAAETMRRLLQALDEAGEFVRRMPTDKVGMLFLEGVRPVQPDPARLNIYTPHAGARRGHWPSSLEVDGAMLDRTRAPPA